MREVEYEKLKWEKSDGELGASLTRSANKRYGLKLRMRVFYPNGIKGVNFKLKVRYSDLDEIEKQRDI